MRRIVLVIISVIFCVSLAKAQFGPCKDENFADPFFQCTADYNPVCACDNVTYVSGCSAARHGGIQSNQWISGVCEPFWFYVPRIVSTTTAMPFRMQFQSRGGSVSLLIADIFGKIYYQRTYNRSNESPVFEDFDTSIFQYGVYVITVYSGNHKQTEKFSVIQF